ncbi:MAG: M15 family metallopeptidase [Oscillospiraceae bacterium]|nr:M15 family metallopeptidase [Oscillospiraceae bacterium]
MDEKQKRPAPAGKKRWLLLAVLLLAAASLIFLLTRVRSWSERQEKTKLLTIVDRDHPVAADYNVEFTLLGGGQMVDSRCVDDLELMLKACAEAGGAPELRGSFRTWGAQEAIYEEALAALIAEGLDAEKAAAALERRTPLPGCSEHELGLAVDIGEQGSELPLERQGDSFTLRWLAENCWDFGFIVRYPEGKTAITGMEAQPWHFRYVGREAAAQIRDLDLTLEEYIQMFYS